MAKEFDRVKFSIPAAPGTGTVTVGTRSDNSFFLPEEQGAVDGDAVYYVIQKSNKDTEVGIGTIGDGQTTVSRDTVLSSLIAGVAGTSKINIDGSAFMAFVTPAYALKSLRVVRSVTGTTGTLADGDGLGQVTYNSASAVAVTLPQAGASLKFLKGWLVFVRNINAGSVTITPTTSTINGATTLVLANGDSAMIISDGTNYTAIVWRAIVPVSAGGTGDTGTAWTSYTPTITAQSGAFTTVSATGRYKQIGKTTFITITVTCTSIGTAAGFVRATLPVSAYAHQFTLSGGNFNTGLAQRALIETSGSSALIANYDNSFPIANGQTVTVSGVYEAA